MDHQVLIGLMAEIEARHHAGLHGKPTLDAIIALANACMEHFAAEEAHFEAIDFAGRTRHTLIHRDLMNRFAAHAERIGHNDGIADEAFFSFLDYWVLTHIKGLDQDYAVPDAPTQHRCQRAN